MKNDLYIILVAAAVALIAFLARGITQKEGDYVSVSVDGETVGTFPMNEDTEHEIQGVGGVNLLVIEDGECFIREADCPDELCVKQGKISRKGESVICLPHKVVVGIEGEGVDEDDLDVVVGQ